MLKDNFLSRLVPITFGLLLAAALPARAQTPTQSQVQQMLQSRPDLAGTVRERISSSGLSPDQIRARLRAAGYSETLLDAYMPNAATPAAEPGADVMAAVRFLGIVDAQDQALQPPPSASATAPIAAPHSRIFGLDVFRRSTSQFEPDLAGPVDAAYKVGPRDVLAVILTGGVELSHTLEVTREGFVVVPQVGQIYVANLTLDQVSDVLYNRFRRVYSSLGRSADASTQLFVTIARLRTNQIFVIGEVERPGSYQISGAGTMMTALYAAGGPSDNGNLRRVQLRRGNRVISEFDIYAYLTGGDASRDVRLETGDVVFVPVHGPRVRIAGEITRPGTYEIRPGETLAHLLALAGGMTAEASTQRVLVRRVLPPDERPGAGMARTAIDVTAEALGADRGAGVTLVDGDEVEVFPVADRVRNQISISGAVWVPGNQGYTPGMRLSDALRLAGGVHTDVRSVQISRLQHDQTRRELRTTFTDTLGTPAEDIPLQEDDNITVFGTSDFRPERYVAITGAVRNGGRFPYREGMTLRDLLHYAGGLDDGAYLDRAEIARVPENRTTGMLAFTVTVPLDSTYLLERGIDGKYLGPPGLAVSTRGAPEVPLLPYDNVLILRQPDWSLNRSVKVTGEVMFPGEYTLRSRTERVRDVIARAGGLTATAYPAGAVFVRSANGLGRIGFDLTRVMRDSTFRDNIIMSPGDSLYIPPMRSVVDVRGAVHSPIAVTYVPGANLEYYIRAAGGATYEADRHRAYVQQPNGVVEPYRHRFWIVPDGRPHPQAGAVVVIPTRDPDARRDWGSIVGNVTQVLASLTAIVIVATRN